MQFGCVRCQLAPIINVSWTSLKNKLALNCVYIERILQAQSFIKHMRSYLTHTCRRHIRLMNAVHESIYASRVAPFRGESQRLPLPCATSCQEGTSYGRSSLNPTFSAPSRAWTLRPSYHLNSPRGTMPLPTHAAIHWYYSSYYRRKLYVTHRVPPGHTEFTARAGRRTLSPSLNAIQSKKTTRGPTTTAALLLPAPV